MPSFSARSCWLGLVIAAPPLVATIATPMWGRLADQYGRKKMVMRALFGASIVLALMGFAETALALILLRALQGLTSGIIAANMALVAGECPRERIGFALGSLQVGLFSGVAIGPTVGGLLAERFGFQIPLFLHFRYVGAGGLAGGIWRARDLCAVSRPAPGLEPDQNDAGLAGDIALAGS